MYLYWYRSVVACLKIPGVELFVASVLCEWFELSIVVAA